MIEIVPPHRYVVFRDELREMHRMRYRVFKERLGWDVPVEDGMERDEFDELDPIYVLAFDDDHELAGSWRLLPSTGPTMIGDAFPELLDGIPVPRSPEIWECSRFTVDCHSVGQKDSLCALNRVTSEIFCGLIEYCIAEQITEIVTVYDILIARILPRVGCVPYWQGKFHRVGCTKAVLGRFWASSETLASVRQRGGIQGSVLARPSLAAIDKQVNREQVGLIHA